jgi:hypothetical protein
VLSFAARCTGNGAASVGIQETNYLTKTPENPSRQARKDCAAEVERGVLRGCDGRSHGSHSAPRGGRSHRFRSGGRLSTLTTCLPIATVLLHIFLLVFMQFLFISETFLQKHFCFFVSGTRLVVFAGFVRISRLGNQWIPGLYLARVPVHEFVFGPPHLSEVDASKVFFMSLALPAAPFARTRFLSDAACSCRETVPDARRAQRFVPIRPIDGLIACRFLFRRPERSFRSFHRRSSPKFRQWKPANLWRRR